MCAGGGFVWGSGRRTLGAAPAQSNIKKQMPVRYNEFLKFKLRSEM